MLKVLHRIARSAFGDLKSASRKRRARRLSAAAAEGARPIWLEMLEDRQMLSTSMLTYHNDLSSTGVNSTETLLTPATVNVNQFQKQYSVPVDGQVYGQPLYNPGVNITTGNQPGVHDVAFVVTQHDSLYAIDTNGGSILWHDSFIYNPAGNPNPLNPTIPAGVTTVPSADTNSSDISPEIGITSTPVIDPATSSLYLTAKTKQSINGFTHYVYTLYRINIQNGQILTSTIMGDTIYNGGTYYYRATDVGAGSDPYVLGTGDGAISSQAAIANQPAANFGQSRVYFNAMRQMNRPAVTLANGSIYIALASHGDNGPYHGWVLRYNASSLALTGVLNTTPNGGLGGIWEAGGVLVTDAAGNLYFETGNGSFNTNASNFPNGQYFPADHNFGDCFVKIGNDPTFNSPSNQNPNGWGLQVFDYFSPYNNATLNAGDTDLGSGAPVILPDTVGSAAHPHLLIGAGKEGKIYLIDRDHMGGFNPSTDQVVQTQAYSGAGGTGINGSLNTPGFFLNGPGGTSGTLYYFPGYGGNGRAFSVSNGSFSSTYISQTLDTFGQLNGTPSISANGITNAMVWVIDRGSNQLRAYDANNLANEIWTSNSAPNGRDQLNPVVKFTVPTVADGRVMIGTANAMVVYGPPVPPTSGPAAPGNLTAAAVNFQNVNLAWQDNSNNEDQFLIERSLDGSSGWTQIGTASANATTFTDTTTLATTTFYYRVRAYNSFSGGSYSTYSNVVSVTTPQAPPVGTGDGLAAQYYLDAPHLSGTPALTRVDPTINFDWGGGSPGPGIGGDQFSVRWTGQFRPATSQTYTFHTISDDGVRLYVNGSLIIDNWTDHAPTDNTATMALTAGQTYNFTMEFYENGGGAVAKLHWSSPTITDTAIPLLNGGATGQYFNDSANGHLQGTPVVTRVEATIDSTTWPNYAPDPAVGNTNFSARWTGKVQAQYSETYTFYTESDDGVQLFVNGQQLINNWTYHAPIEDIGMIALSAGQQYTIEMDFFQGGGPDLAQLFWSSPSTPKQLVPQSQLYSGVAPAAPSNFASVAASGTQLNLSWNDNSNIETGFELQRKMGAGGTYASVTASPLPPNTTSYMDTALTPGVTYYYRIRALNFAANSAFTPDYVVTTPTPPIKPADAHTTFNSTTRIDLAWTDLSDNEDGFRILRSAPGTDFVTIVTLPANTTSYVDNGPFGAGLTPGTEYQYHIQAFNVAGYNDFTGTDTATLTLPPGTPSVVAGDGQVALSWTAPSYRATNSTLLTFNIYRGTSSGGEGASPIATDLVDQTYTDTSVTNGVTYYYKVTAVEIGGESAPSAESAPATPTGTISPPSAPSGLTASGGNATVALSWSAVAGATSYNIYRSTSSGAEVLVASNVSTNSFTDSGLTNGTTYFYQVTAVNSGGESARSAEVSGRPQAPPAAPTNLAATAGNAQVTLSWTASAGATSYKVYRSTASGAETLLALGIGATSFIDTTVTNGTTYYYQVSAVNGVGESSRSAEVSARPQVPPPAAPTNVTATGGRARVSLSWSEVAGATSYNIYRSTRSGNEVLVYSGVTGTSFVDRGLNNGTTYYYTVTAVGPGGESVWSVEVSATPKVK
jgi:fibronectin type 3 domain-containing protein